MLVLRKSFQLVKPGRTVKRASVPEVIKIF